MLDSRAERHGGRSRSRRRTARRTRTGPSPGRTGWSAGRTTDPHHLPLPGPGAVTHTRAMLLGVCSSASVRAVSARHLPARRRAVTRTNRQRPAWRALISYWSQVTVLLIFPSSTRATREVHARSTAGTCQVNQRTAETGPAGSGFIAISRCILPRVGGADVACYIARRDAMNAPGRLAARPCRGPPQCPEVRRYAAITGGSLWAMYGADGRSLGIFRGPSGSFTEDGRPTNSAEPTVREPPRPPGSCPLYVHAQLETAGLRWTQRDLVEPKATAREAGYPQLTGRFRR